MANIIVTFRIFPRSSDVNYDMLESKIVEAVKPERSEKEPIAFGLKAIIVKKIVKDKEGEIEKIEETLKKVKDVGEIEVIEVTRALES